MRKARMGLLLAVSRLAACGDDTGSGAAAAAGAQAGAGGGGGESDFGGAPAGTFACDSSEGLFCSLGGEYCQINYSADDQALNQCIGWPPECDGLVDTAWCDCAAELEDCHYIPCTGTGDERRMGCDG